MTSESKTRLRQQLQRDEGTKLRAYRDSRGFLTIGTGHNLDADTDLRELLLSLAGGDEREITIDQATADRLLDQDIDVAIHDASTRIVSFDALDDCRQGVLINMTFNLGIFGLLKFHLMLNAVARGDYNDAADEMKNSTWHAQVAPRSTRLETQMRTGVWT